MFNAVCNCVLYNSSQNTGMETQQMRGPLVEGGISRQVRIEWIAIMQAMTVEQVIRVLEYMCIYHYATHVHLGQGVPPNDFVGKYVLCVAYTH